VPPAIRIRTASESETETRVCLPVVRTRTEPEPETEIRVCCLLSVLFPPAASEARLSPKPTSVISTLCFVCRFLCFHRRFCCLHSAATSAAVSAAFPSADDIFYFLQPGVFFFFQSGHARFAQEGTPTLSGFLSFPCLLNPAAESNSATPWHPTFAASAANPMRWGCADACARTEDRPQRFHSSSVCVPVPQCAFRSDACQSLLPIADH
jgi:hypothetical protein